MGIKDASLDDLLKKQAEIQAAIEANRELIKEALREESAEFVKKIETAVEGSSYEAVEFVASSVGIQLDKPVKKRSESPNTTRGRRSRLNEDQKNKIAELHAQEMSVAEISRRIFTDPKNSDYQRINTYIKRYLKAD